MIIYENTVRTKQNTIVLNLLQVNSRYPFHFKNSLNVLTRRYSLLSALEPLYPVRRNPQSLRAVFQAPSAD
jgi:hypothetical protein